jgi:hypothetical protein
MTDRVPTSSFRSGFLSSLAARNVPEVPVALPVVRPRLRARFEPPTVTELGLADAPPVEAEMEVFVERESLPPSVERSPQAEALRDARLTAPSPRARDTDRTPELREARAPLAPQPERAVMRTERMEGSADQVRVERAAQSTVARSEVPAPQQPAEPSTGLRAALPASEPPETGVPEPQEVEGTDRTGEPSEIEARAPWIVRPQAVRPEARPELQGGAPVAAPLSRVAPSEAPAPPPVQVTIGRLEVRAVTPTRVPVPRSRPVQNSSSLEEYLRRSAKR